MTGFLCYFCVLNHGTPYNGVGFEACLDEFFFFLMSLLNSLQLPCVLYNEIILSKEKRKRGKREGDVAKEVGLKISSCLVLTLHLHDARDLSSEPVFVPASI